MAVVLPEVVPVMPAPAAAVVVERVELVEPQPVVQVPVSVVPQAACPAQAELVPAESVRAVPV